MITYLHGNLLRANVDALVNAVNCVGVMGKGIALQFKKAFPANFKAYEQACRRGEVKPGHMFVFANEPPSTPSFLVNFPTKRHWRDPSLLEDIRTGMTALVEEVRNRGIRSLAIPALGCGNGGLDWREVRPVIDSALRQLSDLYVLFFAPESIPIAELPAPELPPELQPDPRYGGFWENLSADELARRQGVGPVHNLDDLVGDWPENESIEDFLAEIRGPRGRRPS